MIEGVEVVYRDLTAGTVVLCQDEEPERYDRNCWVFGFVGFAKAQYVRRIDSYSTTHFWVIKPRMDDYSSAVKELAGRAKREGFYRIAIFSIEEPPVYENRQELQKLWERINVREPEKMAAAS